MVDAQECGGKATKCQGVLQRKLYPRNWYTQVRPLPESSDQVRGSDLVKGCLDRPAPVEAIRSAIARPYRVPPVGSNLR